MAWPAVPLGEIVKPAERWAIPVGGTRYRQLGVRLWGEGAYEREAIDGSETKYGKLNRVNNGDLVVNKIWARNGSVAIVPSTLDGCYVSSEFPLYVPVGSKVDSGWLHWVTKAQPFWEQCDQRSRGTSGKNRIRPEQFLSIPVPLPPLREQRRIVRSLQELDDRVTEATGLIAAAGADCSALWRSCLRREMVNGREIRLHELCIDIIDNLHRNPIYADSGVPCVRSPDVGWGTLNLQTALRTDEAEYRRRTVRGEPMADDIVLVREGGGTGKAALVAPGHRFSLGQRVMMLRPNKRLVLPRFLLYQFLSPLIQEDQIQPLAKGSASPHLNIGALRQFRMRVPSLEDQAGVVERLSALQLRLNEVQARQAEVGRELTAVRLAALHRAFEGPEASAQRVAV
jgi:type I restriction enzyme S subunit